MTHIGAGHSGQITGVRISPDGQYIVSVSDDGAIMRWKFPVSNEQTATPIVPALDLPAESPTPRSPKQELMIVTPKQGEEMVGSGQAPEEMEVGGATPKQEE